MALPPLNFISICTGGAGLDLGVELAIPGARSVCMVEREAFACAQLVAAMEQGLLASAALWSDARTFDGRPWRGLVDGLIGGIPCQPHSLAGRKGGSHDARDLWTTARRIIVQSRPWIILIENVAGMLSAGADEIAGAERVWRDLRKLGYAVEGGLFTAAEVGASHRRERLFVFGVADAGGEQWREGGAGSRGTDWPHAEPPGSGAELSGTLADGDGDGDGLEGIGTDIATPRRQNARRPAGLCDGTVVADTKNDNWRSEFEKERTRSGRARPAGEVSDVVDAEIVGRGKGRAQPAFRRGRNAASGADDAVDDATFARSGGLSIQPRRQNEACHDFDRPSLFPPGPHDYDGWRSALASAPELEPSFRRMAHGLAPRLDIARVDRLRLLGNGVVPLEAAYAIRTFVTRLAARGSRGAAQLVRMMEGME